ncbi:MAG: hypothetical protein GXY44_02255 [Phycisphaerales bacterium]|nr:hypothetical protein [Phycisphaerales bacterium]
MNVRTMVSVWIIVLSTWMSGIAAESAPKVVNTVPATEATGVHPGLEQIVITFDTPIKMNSHSLVVLGDLKFPDLAGDEPISFPDNKTCAIKVKLQPNTAYGLGVNSKTRTGFKSAEDGTPAEPFELRFKTTTAELAGAIRVPVEPQGPHVVKTDPPNGATDLEAGTFDLTIVFNEPMNKGQASIVTPPDGPRLQPIGQPRWEDARTFVAPVMLEAAHNYRLGINVLEPKRFISAGDETPAEPFELKFSTRGAPPVGAETSAPSPEAPGRPLEYARLRYDYRKGDTGRVIRKAILDMKLDFSNGQSIPLGNKMGLNCIEEILAVENGRPVEIRKLISEYLMIQIDQETGQPVAAPKLDEPVAVIVNLRSEPADVNAEHGRPPQELMELLAQDSFVDLLPAGPVKVGQKCNLPAETVEDIKQAFDSSGTGRCDIKLLVKRIGPQEVEDARNEMYRAQGGGTPATYIFEVVEFALDWKQEGVMEGGAPFTMEADGKIVFAIEPGIILSSDVDARITLQPIQTQDENGQPLTITGGGTYSVRNSFEPIAWTRGIKGKGDKAAVEPATPRTEAKPEVTAKPVPPAEEGLVAQNPMSTPRGAIGYQFGLLKQGNIEALKECFAEDIRERITPEAVKTGQRNAESVTLDDLLGEVIESEGLGAARMVRIKMKNGRTLTTLVFTDGKWLAETVWFN